MSNSAERVRAYRHRRRSGLRCVTVRLSEGEIDTLVATQYLAAAARQDPKAIKEATEAFLTEKLLDHAAQG